MANSIFNANSKILTQKYSLNYWSYLNNIIRFIRLVNIIIIHLYRNILKKLRFILLEDFQWSYNL